MPRAYASILMMDLLSRVLVSDAVFIAILTFLLWANFKGYINWNAPAWLSVWRLTGGRPMRYMRSAFTDIVSGEAVNFYEDRLGRVWLATGPWARFRVEPAPRWTAPKPPPPPDPATMDAVIDMLREERQ
jgi:hypothetical protein